MNSMVTECFALLLLAAALVPGLGETREASDVSVNPVRKVVTMLQMMQKKVAAEGELDKEIMCYCKTAGASLAKSIGDCETSLPELVSHIEELEALLLQLKAEVAQHQKDRQAAKDAITVATQIRQAEHKEWVDGQAAQAAQIAMIKKPMAAIAAMDKGAYGLMQEGTVFELLQQKAGAASVASVSKLLMSEALTISDFDRQQLTDFLSEGSSHTPQSGEIIGIQLWNR